MNSYRDLIVYQKSLDFVIYIYRVLEIFPKSEAFGLRDQIRRAAVSIPSNIAEGFDRKSQKEYVRFLRIAYGSSAEVETQLTIAQRLHYLSGDCSEKMQAMLTEIRKMLHKLILVVEAGD